MSKNTRKIGVCKDAEGNVLWEASMTETLAPEMEPGEISGGRLYSVTTFDDGDQTFQGGESLEITDNREP